MNEYEKRKFKCIGEDCEIALRPIFQSIFLHSILLFRMNHAFHHMRVEKKRCVKLKEKQITQFPDIPTNRSDYQKGKNAYCYRDCEDLVEQTLDLAISILKILHPGCSALFVLDNPTGYLAFARDVLIVSKLNLNDGVKNVKEMRNGWYIGQNEEVCS